MFQTNTNTNTGTGDTNWNQITKRGATEVAAVAEAIVETT